MHYMFLLVGLLCLAVFGAPAFSRMNRAVTELTTGPEERMRAWWRKHFVSERIEDQERRALSAPGAASSTGVRG